MDKYPEWLKEILLNVYQRGVMLGVGKSEQTHPEEYARSNNMSVPEAAQIIQDRFEAALGEEDPEFPGEGMKVELIFDGGLKEARRSAGIIQANGSFRRAKAARARWQATNPEGRESVPCEVEVWPGPKKCGLTSLHEHSDPPIMTEDTPNA